MHIFFFLLSLSYGWNRESHRIIANVGSMLMSDASVGFLSRLLSVDPQKVQDSLIEMADWADNQPLSAKYHFTDTPFRSCSVFDRARDCRGGKCLVTGIEDNWKIFVNPKSSDKTKIEALKYIVHFVGDAAQPLHTAFREDRGGIKIELSGGMSLHQLWDYKLLEEHKSAQKIHDRESLEVISSNLLSPKMFDEWAIPSSLLSPPDISRIAEFLVSDTAMTTSCRFAYQSAPGKWIESGDTLIGTAYMPSRQAVMLNQLRKAGVRLGQILDIMVDEAKREFARSEPAVSLIQKNKPVKKEKPKMGRYDILGILGDREY